MILTVIANARDFLATIAYLIEAHATGSSRPIGLKRIPTNVGFPMAVLVFQVAADPLGQHTLVFPSRESASRQPVRRVSVRRIHT